MQSQASTLCVVSHLFLQESDSDVEKKWEHTSIKDLYVIPKRGDHHVQFLTGVFFLYIVYDMAKYE